MNCNNTWSNHSLVKAQQEPFSDCFFAEIHRIKLDLDLMLYNCNGLDQGSVLYLVLSATVPRSGHVGKSKSREAHVIFIFLLFSVRVISWALVVFLFNSSQSISFPSISHLSLSTLPRIPCLLPVVWRSTFLLFFFFVFKLPSFNDPCPLNFNARDSEQFISIHPSHMYPLNPLLTTTEQWCSLCSYGSCSIVTILTVLWTSGF